MVAFQAGQLQTLQTAARCSPAQGFISQSCQTLRTTAGAVNVANDAAGLLDAVACLNEGGLGWQQPSVHATRCSEGHLVLLTRMDKNII